MAGIYLHIPFCKKACHYCDFHFSTQMNHIDEMIKALCKEIVLKKHILEHQSIESIYFGGGTPSAIPTHHIGQILNTIYQHYHVNTSVEITIEANPDDINPQKIKEIKSLSINRFSVGIQSFFEEDLLWMNRAHNALEAEKSIKWIQDAGFHNITLDLIYGYTLLSHQKWAQNIQKAIDFGVPHISCYGLTVEEKTALAHHIKIGKSLTPNDIQAEEQFQYLIHTLENKGFEHYEISNFALPNFYAIHNTNYWKNIPYLGFGPSAHSYFEQQRSWNIAHNRQYIQSLEKNIIPQEIEILSPENQFNEYIMTSLRTQWGINFSIIKERFGEKNLQILLKNIANISTQEWLIPQADGVKLSPQGKSFADAIASSFFLDT